MPAPLCHAGTMHKMRWGSDELTTAAACAVGRLGGVRDILQVRHTRALSSDDLKVK